MYPPKIWREFPQRYRLEASQCAKCKKVAFPTRQVCPGCGGRKFNAITLPKQGRLINFTAIHTPPPAFHHQTPYCVGIVELMEGVQITCQIADASFEELSPGQKVVIEFRVIQKDGESGVIAYGYKAAIAGEHNCIY